MASNTIIGGRFFDPHDRVTFHALLMISCLEPRFKDIFFVKRLAMAVATARWFCRGGAVMMAPLAKRRFFTMEILRQLIILGVLYQCSDHFAVGKFNRFILLRNPFYNDLFGNIAIRQSCGSLLSVF